MIRSTNILYDGRRDGRTRHFQSYTECKWTQNLPRLTSLTHPREQKIVTIYITRETKKIFDPFNFRPPKNIDISGPFNFRPAPGKN